ncbi:MAG: hypothetical protein ACHQRM_02110 [Bacteroidia bacterium]
MKSFFSLSVAVLLTIPAFALAEKDSSEVHLVAHHFFAGTFFNFSSNANTRTNASTLALTGTSSTTYGGDLTGGFMLTSKWAFLIKGGYTENRPVTYQNQPGIGNISLNDDDIVYNVTPTFRYYKQLNDDNFFFLQARFPISFGTYYTENYDPYKRAITSDIYNKFGLGAYIMPGFSSFVSRRIAAEISAGSFGYSYYDGKDAKGNTTHTGGFDGLLYLNSVSLGFVFYF